tara:strand:+ start:262 stop:495 length:234 start_codon:yes stop_codon:yes gene_type:complete
MKSVLLEPDWARMFDYAVQLTKDEVAEDGRRDTIIAMLEFGKRLWEDRQVGTVGDTNREITQGLKEIRNGRNGTEVE